WLEPAGQGDVFLALAQQERASRLGPHRVATRAEAAGGGYRLSGEKIAVLDGASADALIVVARTSGADDDRQGISLFLVANDAKGLHIERQSRVDSRGAAVVRLDDCAVG